MHMDSGYSAPESAEIHAIVNSAAIRFHDRLNGIGYFDYTFRIRAVSSCHLSSPLVALNITPRGRIKHDESRHVRSMTLVYTILSFAVRAVGI